MRTWNTPNLNVCNANAELYEARDSSTCCSKYFHQQMIAFSHLHGYHCYISLGLFCNLSTAINKDFLLIFSDNPSRGYHLLLELIAPLEKYNREEQLCMTEYEG